ncbi:SigE family RNA polymerase sigma factor [Kribbella sandramycini]|uniref:RNA polymerase sigma-70 factor (Sigma-E family) n=1 Tax=Kribbella sandramycini TaxID=60450 RepID=A0A7Y4KYT3_9ACTN|nr:SigE family RNA polymerase sigma factor [Kribbella sandramycini]MBB6568981.1 RNA polymerase sigma-70 factor (sigma-E family) [Kribbella sandramycini]NOL41174.1 SigE family RNA polymerase sigma factor [Kribbella sandramycini]
MKDRPTAADFDDFVRARWSATARLAYALTLDHQRAEDLAQESFTKLWFHWDRVSGGSPEGYLRRIVTTTFLSGRRRRWLGERPTETPPDVAVAARTGEIDERLALHRAMAQLSPRQRATLYLRYAEDLPERTVAELLGCSVGAVKQHARRGLDALRADLDFTTTDTADLAVLAGGRTA